MVTQWLHVAACGWRLLFWTVRMEDISITAESSTGQQCSAHIYLVVIILIFCLDYCYGLQRVEMPHKEKETDFGLRLT